MRTLIHFSIEMACKQTSEHRNAADADVKKHFIRRVKWKRRLDSGFLVLVDQTEFPMQQQPFKQYKHDTFCGS